MQPKKLLKGLLLVGISMASITTHAHRRGEGAQIIKKMFLDSNENFLLVMALDDGLITEGQPYSFVFSPGYLRINDRALPEQDEQRYLSMVHQFYLRRNQAEPGMLSLRGDGIRWKDVKNPESSWNKVYKEQKQAISTSPIRPETQPDVSGEIKTHLLADNLIQPKEPYILVYNKTGVTLNNKLLDPRMNTKYQKLISQLTGFTPEKAGDSYSFEQR